MHAWKDVAVLAKTKNAKGGLVAHAATGLPLLLSAGDEIALVPPKLDVPRRVVVSDITPIDEFRAFVWFEGVDANVASELAGMHCLVPAARLDSVSLEDVPAAWCGWRVEDARHGYVGDVVDVMDNPAQSLLEVQREDGRGTVLIPIVDEIVTDVDVDNGVVRVSMPKGLMDL